jgi:hypothetical protein
LIFFKSRQKQIEENIKFELKTAEENYAENNKTFMNQLLEKEVCLYFFNLIILVAFFYHIF